jgi:hypothetical protein
MRRSRDSGRWFAELVPYRWRRVHHWYATAFGFFWLPCGHCGLEYGGHEWRDLDGLPCTIAVQSRATPDGLVIAESTGICPVCTRAGYGERAWTL